VRGTRQLATGGPFCGRNPWVAELKSFEDLRRRAPLQPVLVYLTHPDYDHLRAFLSPRRLCDLEELWAILKESLQGPDIPAWLRSESDAFAGQRPIELLKEGRARDIIVEFRRLQSGEPA